MSDSFRRLAEAYKDRIYNLALYSLKRPEEAEDVTQEVLIKLWKNREGVDPERLTAWVMRVTRNAVIDVARRRKTRSTVIADEVEVEVATNMVGSESDTGRGVESREIREALQSAIARLEEPYRGIIVMREIEQMTYSEITAAMDMPLNTVKVYLHRARRMLREELRGKYQHDGI